MAFFNNVLYDISNNNYNVFEPIFIDGLNTIPMSGKKYYNSLFPNLMCAFAVDNGDSILGGNAIISGDLNSCANVYINRTLTVSGYIFNKAIINSLTPSNALVNKLYVDSLTQSYINNITIGTTTTGAAGTSAIVTKTGTAPNATLNFTIPQGVVGATGSVGPVGPTGSTGAFGGIGATGPSGSVGPVGPTGSTGASGSNGTNGSNETNGAAATITVGTTTTGAAGTSAAVSNGGTTSAAIINFTIPQGSIGATGATGATGVTGAAGTSGATILSTANTWTNTNTHSSGIVNNGGITGTGNIATGGIFISNNNYAVPSLGGNGGTGDKLILFGGTTTTYPYSLGIAASELWYSVPIESLHKFYVNGSSIATINSTGIGIGTTTPQYKLDVNGTANISSNLTVGSTAAAIPSITLTGAIVGGTSAGITIGQAYGSTNYSLNAVGGDSVIRTNGANNMILQSGGGAAGLTITSSNKVCIGQNGNYGYVSLDNGGGNNIMGEWFVTASDNATQTACNIAFTSWWGMGWGSSCPAQTYSTTRISQNYAMWLDCRAGNLSIANSLSVAGNTGIGTTSPAYKLDVIGTAHISSNLTVDGSFSIGTITTNSSITLTGAISGGTSASITIGQAAATGNYSLNAVGGDTVIRTNGANNMILQSKDGYGALKIDTTNNITVYNNLSVGGNITYTGSQYCFQYTTASITNGSGANYALNTLGKGVYTITVYSSYNNWYATGTLFINTNVQIVTTASSYNVSLVASGGMLQVWNNGTNASTFSITFQRLNG